ncbi:MAG TPA: MFS transporter [Polyangiaceae bacterium]|nr:MFS transporter [Polyangiaceae bacterium]
MTRAERPALPRALLLSLFLVILVDISASTSLMPVLPIFAQQLGASALGATMLSATFSACQLLATPVLGALSDRVGRKRVLVFSQLGTFGGLVLTAVSGSVWQLYAGRAIDGFTAGNVPVAYALTADRTPPERRSEAFSILLAAFGTGLFVGPLLSGYLARFDIRTPIFVGAALSALSVAVSWALLPGGPPASGGGGGPAAARPRGPGSLFRVGTYAEYFRRPRLGPLLVQFLLFMLAVSSFFTCFAVFVVRAFPSFGASEVGYLLAYGGVLSILFQGLAMRALARRFGDGRLVKAGFATAALGQFALGAAHSVPVLVASCTLVTLGFNVLRPTLTSLVSREVGPDEQGAVLGVTRSLESVAGMASPLVGGLLLDRGWAPAWAWYMGLLALSGLALARLGERPGEARALPEGGAP